MKIRTSDPCPCGSGKTFGECHDVLRKQKETREADLLHIALTVIPPPDPGMRAVFELASGSQGLLMTGVSGRHSLDCGNCSAPLAIRMDRNQLQGIVLRCSRCGRYNDT